MTVQVQCPVRQYPAGGLSVRGEEVRFPSHLTLSWPLFVRLDIDDLFSKYETLMEA